MKSKTKQIAIAGMLSAIAFLCVMYIRIPAVLFLKYEPKDVIITIGTLVWGPLVGIFVTVTVAILELFSISSTGPIGCIMNILSSLMFACIPAMIYRKNKTLKNAVIGLAVGSFAMTFTMLLWNYIVTPIYMGIPRAQVLAMLPTVFLPFNLIKSGLNASIVLLLYKPVVARLVKLTKADTEELIVEPKGKFGVGVMIASSVLIAVCISATLYLS